MRKFSGIIVPMLTPFDLEGEIDEERLTSFIEFLIDGGVDGLFPSSSVGEASSMSISERKRLIMMVRDKVDGRLPVIPGTGSSDVTSTLQLTRYAEDIGCDAAIVVTPYYLKPDQEGLKDYFSRIATAVDIPLFLYQIPMATGVRLAPGTVAYLHQEHSSIVGMKDSSGDMASVIEIIGRMDEDFMVFQGWDTLLLPSLVMGCAGGMVSTPNIIPQLSVGLYDAFSRGDLEEARQIQIRKLGPFFQTCMDVGVFPAGFKEASRMLGLDLGGTRPAIRPLRKEEILGLEASLKELGFLE